MKQFLAFLPRALLAIFLSAIAGWGLLAFTFAYPNTWALRHAGETHDLFVRESGFFYMIEGMRLSAVDNMFDAQQIIKVYEDDLPMPAFRQALLTPYHRTDVESPVKALVDHLEGKPGNGIWKYLRYWSGTLVILKPLLSITGYPAARAVNAIVIIYLLALIAHRISRSDGDRYLLRPLLFSLFLVSPFSYLCSIQLSITFSVALVVFLIFLRYPDAFHNQANLGWLCLGGGVAVAYVDVLTTPILPVGLLLPAVCVRNRGSSLGNLVRQLTWCIGAFFLGYFGMWAMKWILCATIGIEDMASNILIAARNRASNTVNESWMEQSGCIRIDFVSTLAKILSYFDDRYFYVLLSSISGFYLIRLLHNRTWKGASSSDCWLLPALAVCACLPLAWFRFLENHAFAHAHMTRMNMMVCFFPILVACEFATGPMCLENRLGRKPSTLALRLLAAVGCISLFFRPTLRYLCTFPMDVLPKPTTAVPRHDPSKNVLFFFDECKRRTLSPDEQWHFLGWAILDRIATPDAATISLVLDGGDNKTFRIPVNQIGHHEISNAFHLPKTSFVPGFDVCVNPQTLPDGTYTLHVVIEADGVSVFKDTGKTFEKRGRHFRLIHEKVH